MRNTPVSQSRICVWGSYVRLLLGQIRACLACHIVEQSRDDFFDSRIIVCCLGVQNFRLGDTLKSAKRGGSRSVPVDESQRR